MTISLKRTILIGQILRIDFFCCYMDKSHVENALKSCQCRWNVLVIIAFLALGPNKEYNI